MRLETGAWVLWLVVLVPCACGGDDFTSTGSGGGPSGGASGNGGSGNSGGSVGGSGGENKGGENTGGENTGGVSSGGVGNTGGVSSGGVGNTGGVGTGGVGNTGGVSTGGVGNTGGGSSDGGNVGGTGGGGGVHYGVGNCPSSKPLEGTNCIAPAVCCYGFDPESVVTCKTIADSSISGPGLWFYDVGSLCCPSSHPTVGATCFTNSELVCCYGGTTHYFCAFAPGSDKWGTTASACSNG